MGEVIANIPLMYRWRRWLSVVQTIITTADTEFEVPVYEVLPVNWQDRFWCLSEVRGTRSNSSVIDGLAAVLSSIKAKEGTQILPKAATAGGITINAASAPIPVFAPMPANWTGVLVAASISDAGANIVFRHNFGFIELTELEWRTMLCGFGTEP